MRFQMLVMILLTAAMCACGDLDPISRALSAIENFSSPAPSGGGNNTPPIGISSPGGGGGGGGNNSPPPINTVASPSSGGNCQSAGGIVNTQVGAGCGASSSPNTGASSGPAPVVGASSGPAPVVGASSAPSGASTMSEITFYNTASSGSGPTSSGVPAHEGSGAYSDPITFATAPTEVPMQGLIYVKGFNKYFIHTDDCVSCTSDWASGKYHQDLWLGTDSANCATVWGVLQLPIVISPPSTLPVSSQAMDDGTCFPLPSPLPAS
jgi:hypothetical protein